MMLARRARRVLGTTLGTATLIGCSLIVPDEVPSYRCSGSDPSACPSGLVCDPIVLLCVSPSALSDGGDEPPIDEGDGDVPETGPDGPTGPSALGGNCVVDTDCASGLLCGTSTILTTAIVATNSKSVCTRPCCTSGDCAAGFVCFSAGTGGNYCVAAKKANRTPPSSGGKSGGQTCSDPTDCRSGLCTDGRCTDSCCHPSDCASGTTCRIATLDGNTAWACAAPNAGATLDLGGACNGDNSKCKNDNCVTPFAPSRCNPPCCSASDCEALGFSGNVCWYGSDGNDQLKWCFGSNPSGKAVGQPCTAPADCASRYCDAELGICTTVCCTNADCASGEVCRPTAGGLPLLRCVSRR